MSSLDPMHPQSFLFCPAHSRHVSSDIENEQLLNEAFENMDVQRVAKIIKNGGNPNQLINPSVKITAYFYAESFATMELYNFSQDPEKFLVETYNSFESDFTLHEQKELSIVLNETLEKLKTEPASFEILHNFYFSLCKTKKNLEQLESEFKNVSEQELNSIKFPAFAYAILLKDLDLLKLMVEQGAHLSDFYFYKKVYDSEGVCEDEGHFLDPFRYCDKGMQIIRYFLEQGYPFENLFRVDRDFFETLFYYDGPFWGTEGVYKRTENYDELISLLEKHYDFRLLLKQDATGQTELSQVVASLIENYSNRALETLEYLLQKFPNYAAQYPEESFSIDFQFRYVFLGDNSAFDTVLREARLYALKDKQFSWVETRYKGLKILLEKGFQFHNLFFVDEEEELMTSQCLVSFAAYAVVQRDYEMLELLKANHFDFNAPLYIKSCFSLCPSEKATRTLLGYVLKGNDEGEMDLEMCQYLIENGATKDHLNRKLAEKLDAFLRDKQ